MAYFTSAMKTGSSVSWMFCVSWIFCVSWKAGKTIFYLGAKSQIWGNIGVRCLCRDDSRDLSKCLLTANGLY